MTAARTPHTCVPRAETVSALRDGSRTSMRERCLSCGLETTWIKRNDGAVVPLDGKAKGTKR